MSAALDDTRAAAARLVDGLLQPSLLLVVELQHGAVPLGGAALWARCISQVERLREALEQAGLSAQSIDYISHAQCALLDQTLLEQEAGDAYALWERESLQARFFNHHQAGEKLYEQLRQALHEAVPDVHVLTAFQRVLTLGFKGRYQALEHPERQQLLDALNTQVATFASGEALLTRIVPAKRLWHTPSLLAQVAAVATLLLLAWLGLDALLNDAIGQLPGQG